MMSPRVVAVAIIAAGVFTSAGVYARPAPESRPVTEFPALACGSERWAVKTLTDPAASKINFAKVKSTTVEGLRHLKVPKNLKATSLRRTGAERTVYSVNALLMSMKREDDADIHLVIADPKLGGSMIVEFPSDACTASAAPVLRVAMTQARADLAAACGGEAGGSAVTLTGSATISGVGFFDLIHGQAGVAPNGIELHPVLTFTSTNCQRVAVKHRG
jgi:hypothetical protein